MLVMLSSTKRSGQMARIGVRMLATVQHKTSEGHALKSDEKMRVTTLPSGLVVASAENYSPISRIGVIVRAGSRYEPPNALGVTHVLRSAAGLSTQRSTGFGITRNIEYNGGRLISANNREFFIYALESNRDYLAHNIEFLADTIVEPAFKPWELSDNIARIKVDLALLKETPQLTLLEGWHRAAYRGGLSNSLFSPEYMLGKNTREVVFRFINDHFVSNRMAIVGLGVDHDLLLKRIDKRFTFIRGDGGQSGDSKFIGGELRFDSANDITFVAVGAEGVGYKNQKDMLVLSLFQSLLGTGSRVKYSIGSASKLGAAVAKVAENPFAISSVNINYSDTGLFGITLAANSKEVHKIVKTAVSQLRESAKNIAEQDLKNAKNALKASILMAIESQLSLVEECGTQLLTTGQVYNYNDIVKAIDAITINDVTSLTQKIIKGKGAMASVGNLSNTPYLEDLV